MNTRVLQLKRRSIKHSTGSSNLCVEDDKTNSKRQNYEQLEMQKKDEKTRDEKTEKRKEKNTTRITCESHMN